MRKALRITAIVYAVYLALALLVISPALNFLPHRYMEDTYGWNLQTGWVLLNPFKLSLDIKDAQLSDHEGEPVASFGEASINLSLQSLWQSGWVLDALKLQGIALSLTRLSEEEYNFSALLSAEQEEETPKAEAGIPGFTIRDLDLHSDSIALTDQTREKTFNSRWDGLHIRASDFSTVIEEGRPYSVNLKGDGGGAIHWEGDVSLPRGESAGRLSISDLNLRKAWEFAEPWLSFELKKGKLDLEGDYQLNWSETFQYSVGNGQVTLSDIDIQPLNPEALPDTAAGLKSLQVSNINLDSKTFKAGIGGLTVEDLALASWREGSQISLAEMFIPSSEDSDPTEPADSEETGDPSWSVVLNQARLVNGQLRWRSDITEPALLEVRPITVEIEHIAWPLEGDSSLKAEITINEQARIAVGGALDLASGTGDVNYSLEGLPLGWFDPNLPEALKATIASGLAELEGQMSLGGFTPVTITLDGAIRDFALRMDADGGRLTSLESLRLDGLNVNMEERSVLLKKLSIDGHVGQLHINRDGSVNTSNIWKEEVSERAEEIAEDLAGDTPWSFSLPEITVSDSEIDFMDESLPIQFRTVIGQLEGEVLNISSDPDSIATVDIAGTVDEYAPVSLEGSLSPFAKPLGLDLRLKFNSVDMALLTPYSGTYAGYNIDQGLLDLDLEYTLKEQQLEGNNAIRIDKLKLGEKIESDKAADLPLKMALAILTDKNGVIDMKVPVSGNVDDPSFELGSVIGGAFVNVIAKIITSPFTLLAGLADSEEDLQRLNFTPGYADLSDQNKGKLDSLVTALEQRPSLSLVVTGRINHEADRERMQKNVLKAQLLEDGLSMEEIEVKGPEWEEAIEERYAALESPGGTPAGTVRVQYEQVYGSIEIPQAQLTELAEQRAVTVKTYLVNEAGLAPDRAVVGQPSQEEEDNTFSGVELGVES